MESVSPSRMNDPSCTRDAGASIVSVKRLGRTIKQGMKMWVVSRHGAVSGKSGYLSFVYQGFVVLGVVGSE
jgi:hypothetical protein